MTAPATIDALINGVIQREGGFVDHPADKGGPTKYGITEKVARGQGWNGRMQDMPVGVAAEIYRQLYWFTPRFDFIARKSLKVATELFDTGVNMGPRVAIGFLQRSLNALNREAKDYPDVVVDCSIGAATTAALDAFLKARPNGEAVLMKALEALQGARYIELSEKRPKNEAFTFGWLQNRVGSFA